jgi:3-isopropylmalate/(R)-2-methylmalate dehydratase small subunit
MSAVTSITGRGIPLLLDDIDTDRIIPARYLRCVTFDGLGEHAFEDDRKQDPKHPFDDPRFQGASILIAGRNFGCGSSREHAPQSLMRWGIRAVMAESFAEIFFGNCTSLGIAAVTADRGALTRLAAHISSHPQTELTVNLVNLQVTCGDETYDCDMPPSARDALVSGQWDFLGQLLENIPGVQSTAETLPYMHSFA